MLRKDTYSNFYEKKICYTITEVTFKVKWGRIN